MFVRSHVVSVVLAFYTTCSWSLEGDGCLWGILHDSRFSADTASDLLHIALVHCERVGFISRGTVEAKRWTIVLSDYAW